MDPVNVDGLDLKEDEMHDLHNTRSEDLRVIGFFPPLRCSSTGRRRSGSRATSRVTGSPNAQ